MTYHGVNSHRSMVFDAVRNLAYARAMEKAIGPGATVLDLGAGLGVHGLNAAVLGAAEVHLVDPSPVLEVSRRIAADNGLDNLRFHACRVEELELDARVDVLVSVFTGNFLLTEDLLPSLFVARDRFLAPGGTMIPDRACMEVVPVSVPEYYREHVEVWSDHILTAERQGLPAMDYSAARSYAANTLYYASRSRFQPTLLGPPAVLMELDFLTASDVHCDQQVEAVVARSGCCHGWLGWFRMRLGEDWLTTSGEEVSTHWHPVFLPVETPFAVEAGDRLGFRLQRPAFGDWTWTTAHGGDVQRQSTFLSRSLTLAQWRRAAESYQPRLTRRGEMARWVLEQMHGELSVTRLSELLLARYPGVFPGKAEALQMVRRLTDDYG